jgi:hypothetical protein
MRHLDTVPSKHNIQGNRAVLDRVPELDFDFVRLWRFRRACVRLAFRYSGAVQPQAESPDRARNILDALLAQIIEAHRDLVADMIAHAAGNANTTGFCEPFKAGCDVDTVAENVTVFYHYVADVYPDAKLHLPFFGQSVIRLGERVLNLNRCVDCIENARKFCKHAVPRCSGDPTTVAQDRLINDKAVLGERRERLLLIGLH